MLKGSRYFRVRRKALFALAGSLTLLGAILAFAYTTYQNDVGEVPNPEIPGSPGGRSSFSVG